jgi:Bacterial mobilisation protein (MobC)
MPRNYAAIKPPCHGVRRESPPIGFPPQANEGIRKRFSMNAAGQNGEQGTAAKKSRSGSATRQKTTMAGFRVTAEELQDLRELAGRQRLTVASYMRRQTLEHPTTRTRRRANPQTEVLSAILAQLGKLGGNMNQIARRMNMNETPLASEIQDAFVACRQVSKRVNDLLTGADI